MSLLMEELRRRAAAGEHAAALQLARELLREPGGCDRDLFDVARIGAGAAARLGEYFTARQLAELERQYAVAADDPDLIAIANFHRGTADLYISCTSDALEAFSQFAAIDTPSRPSLDQYRASCWFNVGTAHMHRREYERAAAALDEARALYLAENDPHGAAECHLQAAWALMLAERFEPAAVQLEAAGQILAEHPDDGLQLYGICHRAYFHYRHGEYTRAMTLCYEVFQKGRTAVNHHHRSEAAWIIGECALALGEVEKAADLAATASDQALKAGESWLINRANDLRNRIQAAREQTA